MKKLEGWFTTLWPSLQIHHNEILTHFCQRCFKRVEMVVMYLDNSTGECRNTNLQTFLNKNNWLLHEASTSLGVVIRKSFALDMQLAKRIQQRKWLKTNHDFWRDIRTLPPWGIWVPALNHKSKTFCIYRVFVKLFSLDNYTKGLKNYELDNEMATTGNI